MKLTFRKKDPYDFQNRDICDENGKVVFHIEGEARSGDALYIHNDYGVQASITIKGLRMKPILEIFFEERAMGCLKCKNGLLKTSYCMGSIGWHVTIAKGIWNVMNSEGQIVATIHTEHDKWPLKDYIIDIAKEQDVLMTVVLFIAIYAENCITSDWASNC